MSQFELSRSGIDLVLTINVEKANFFRSLKNFQTMILKEQKAEVNDYLQRKTLWIINESSHYICNYSLVQDKGHFLIQGYFENMPQKIDQIYFKNEFLTEEIYGHLNIVHFRLNQQLRSFKMDKSREKITVEFN
jgi:hypothetical protein